MWDNLRQALEQLQTVLIQEAGNKKLAYDKNLVALSTDKNSLNPYSDPNYADKMVQTTWNLTCLAQQFLNAKLPFAMKKSNRTAVLEHFYLYDPQGVPQIVDAKTWRVGKALHTFFTEVTKSKIFNFLPYNPLTVIDDFQNTLQSRLTAYEEALYRQQINQHFIHLNEVNPLIELDKLIACYDEAKHKQVAIDNPENTQLDGLQTSIHLLENHQRELTNHQTSVNTLLQELEHITLPQEPENPKPDFIQEQQRLIEILKNSYEEKKELLQEHKMHIDTLITEAQEQLTILVKKTTTLQLETNAGRHSLLRKATDALTRAQTDLEKAQIKLQKLKHHQGVEHMHFYEQKSNTLARARIKQLKNDHQRLHTVFDIINNRSGIYLPIDQIPFSKETLQTLLNADEEAQALIDKLYETSEEAARRYGLNWANLKNRTTQIMTNWFSANYFFQDEEGNLQDIIIGNEFDENLNDLLSHIKTRQNQITKELAVDFRTVPLDRQPTSQGSLYEIQRNYHDQLKKQEFNITNAQADVIIKKNQYHHAAWEIKLLETQIKLKDAAAQQNGFHRWLNDLQEGHPQDEWIHLKHNHNWLEFKKNKALLEDLLSHISHGNDAPAPLKDAWQQCEEQCRTLQQKQKQLMDEFHSMKDTLRRTQYDELNQILKDAFQATSLEEKKRLHEQSRSTFQCMNQRGFFSKKLAVSTNEYSNKLEALAQRIRFDEQTTAHQAKLNSLYQRFFAEQAHSSEMTGLFNAYLTARETDYFWRDFCESVAAISLKLFGFKTEKSLRRDYVNKLNTALAKYCKVFSEQPYSSETEEAYDALQQCIEDGLKFKPRSKDINSSAYKHSLRHHLEVFQEALESIRCQQPVSEESTDLNLR